MDYLEEINPIMVISGKSSVEINNIMYFEKLIF